MSEYEIKITEEKIKELREMLQRIRDKQMMYNGAVCALYRVIDDEDVFGRIFTGSLT